LFAFLLFHVVGLRCLNKRILIDWMLYYCKSGCYNTLFRLLPVDNMVHGCVSDFYSVSAVRSFYSRVVLCRLCVRNRKLILAVCLNISLNDFVEPLNDP